MTDKFAALPPKIMQFLVIAFCPTSAAEERVKALRIVDEYLASVGSDGYELLKRLTTQPVTEPAITEEDMQKILDKGRELGRAEVLEQQCHAPPVAPNPPFGGGLGFGSGSGRVAGDDTFNGFRLLDIAQHCAANSSRIPLKHHGFIEGMADQLEYDTISEPQAKYLCNLFRQHLGGRI